MERDYPAGAYNDPNAPYNEVEIPEKEFEVTCSQCISKTTTVFTSNYIPGASGVDYEPDGEGGYCASGWQDDDDTSNTDWGEEYHENDHYTPLQLIELFGATLEEIIDTVPENKQNKFKHLIEECKNWTEDETEYIL